MKKLLLFVLAATALAACSTDTTQDLAPEIPTAPDELQVSFDEEDTRIQLGENGAPVWTEGDLVSVFYRSNANSKYQFTGETGDANGSIKLVEEGVATQQTTQIVAVYPYSEDYWFNWNTYDIEASLPAEQTYLKDSFGVGSSLMVSSNVFTQLSFKNVCGWLKLQFTGTGYVSKIVLKGNNGEQVAGKIYVNTSDASSTLASTMGESGDDIIESRVGGFIEEEGAILTEITLNCGDGVALNSETPTAFYVALPPQTFEKGFTATMYGCDGSTKEISTENLITIERNHILPMASAMLEMPIPSNEIWYTSSDGNVIEPNATDVFGANITSNTYENGVGVITFDGDVTKIGNGAFYYCTKLTSITIPNSVTSIGIRAFEACVELTNITIPDNVVSIGDEAFNICSKLTSITIPDSVTKIGSYAFQNCSALEAFYGKFASADNRCLIVDGVLKSFAIGCKLTTYSIPDSVTKISGLAFYKCPTLTSVTIPDSVTDIVNGAFRDCTALEAFYGKFVSEDNRCLVVDGVLSSFAPIGLTTYTIPDNVTEIGVYTFQNCDALTSITIPDSVTTIRGAAFEYCFSLTSVTIGNSVTTIEGSAFYRCTALKEVYCKSTTPPSLGRYAFDYNASGRKIYVPTASVDAYKAADGWKEYADAIVAMPIPSNQIWYTSSDGNVIEPYSGNLNSNATAMQTFGANITSNTYENGVGVITFDGDVTTIGERASWGWSALTSVTIPDNVTTIGDSAFANCDALTSITIPDSVTEIGSSAFWNGTALTSVTIPDSVTTIGRSAFYNCDALTSVTIPDSVMTIGDFAFRNCSALTSITIPDSVTKIGMYAFCYCDALTSIIIPNSVTTIGDSAFANCDALKTVYCKPTTPPSLYDYYVFYNNASGRKIYVPTASVDAYKAASSWSEYADAIEPYNFTE